MGLLKTHGTSKYHPDIAAVTGILYIDKLPYYIYSKLIVAKLSLISASLGFLSPTEYQLRAGSLHIPTHDSL